ncbi:MAG: sugar phosphate nucleotidyltransferase, partial [Metallosphaera sp.]
MVSAIILAGGWATRLRPLSLTKPKPLFPVLGRPILDYTLDSLDRAGIQDIYISLRVMADKIIKHV